jgi:hypothetical protein
LLADYGLAAVYGSLLANRYGIPLIYSSHNVEYRMYLEQSQSDLRRLLLAPYVYWAERTACRSAKLVVSISEQDARHYSQWIARDRLEVIGQGFEPELSHPFYEPPPRFPPAILFVGSFRDENNRQAARQIVREILPVVTQAYPEAKFQLVGAEPPEDLAGPNVECPGFVADLAPYWRRANLAIAPMPFHHGMSTKVIAALAFGKTVLTTPQVASTLPRPYRQLQVAPLERFAAAIVALLATCPPVDASEFDLLCQDFAWPDAIARLHQRIEACCAAHTLLKI